MGRKTRILTRNRILQVLKMYGWEKSFEKQINEIRDRELKGLKKIAILKAVSSLLWNVTPFIVSSFVSRFFEFLYA